MGKMKPYPTKPLKAEFIGRGAVLEVTLPNKSRLHLALKDNQTLEVTQAFLDAPRFSIQPGGDTRTLLVKVPWFPRKAKD